MLGGGTAQAVVPADHRKHPCLTVVFREGIHIHKGVLLQEVLPYHTGGLQRDLILGGKGVLTYQLHDLIKACLLLQDGHRPFPVHQEGLAEVLLIPRPQAVDIKRIGIEPVNGREVPPIGKACIQRPEHLYNSHRCLRNRLGKVTAGGRYRTDCGQRAAAFLIAADAGHRTGTLIELRQTGGKVGGIALFTGHLLQTAAHLTQGLCPAGGGVGDNRHGIAHVTVVFRYGNTGIDGRFTGGHRHIGGIGNEHGTLHQRLPGTGINQFREFPQNIGHLVAALAAANVDHQIHIRPLGQGMLHYRLA